MKDYLIITFESTHIAIKTEKQLQHLDIDVIPTPRQLSTSCGIAIKTDVTHFEAIKMAMGEQFGQMSQCYFVSVNDGVLNFKKL